MSKMTGQRVLDPPTRAHNSPHLVGRHSPMESPCTGNCTGGLTPIPGVLGAISRAGLEVLLGHCPAMHIPAFKQRQISPPSPSSLWVKEVITGTVRLPLLSLTMRRPAPRPRHGPFLPSRQLLTQATLVSPARAPIAPAFHSFKLPDGPEGRPAPTRAAFVVLSLCLVRSPRPNTRHEKPPSPCGCIRALGRRRETLHNRRYAAAISRWRWHSRRARFAARQQRAQKNKATRSSTKKTLSSTGRRASGSATSESRATQMTAASLP